MVWRYPCIRAVAFVALLLQAVCSVLCWQSFRRLSFPSIEFQVICRTSRHSTPPRFHRMFSPIFAMTHDIYLPDPFSAVAGTLVLPLDGAQWNPEPQRGTWRPCFWWIGLASRRVSYEHLKQSSWETVHRPPSDHVLVPHFRVAAGLYQW